MFFRFVLLVGKGSEAAPSAAGSDDGGLHGNGADRHPRLRILGAPPHPPSRRRRCLLLRPGQKEKVVRRQEE